MKLLIINALVKGGGTEVQTHREYTIFKNNGHDVHVLTFDNNEKEGRFGDYFNLNYSRGKVHNVLYRTKIDMSLLNNIKKILEMIEPEVIHINNLQDNAFTVLEACKGFSIIKTIRDPGLICPKGTCLQNNGTICSGYEKNNCVKCIGWKINYQILNWQMQKIRQLYKVSVTRFVCPSEYLTRISVENGFDTTCVNNSFDFSVVSKTAPVFDKTFLYYGMVSKEKGIERLVDVFNDFSKSHSDAHLYIAGKLEGVKEDSLCGKNIHYLGMLNQSEIMKLYERVYCVIVPSIWLENYPNTVLEALACKTLVIGSNRGGIPELIGDDQFLFDPLNRTDFYSIIDYVYSFKKEEYESITEKKYFEISQNNTLNKYYERMQSIIGTMTEMKKDETCINC